MLLGMWDLLRSGIKPCLLHWKGRVLTLDCQGSSVKGVADSLMWLEYREGGAREVPQSVFHRVQKSVLYIYILFFFLEVKYLVFVRVSPEKAMAPHSSTLAWQIPWTEEPGRLQSMGSRRVGHD